MIQYLLFITLAFGLILMQFGKASTLNFDNILKTIRASIAFTGTTAVSLEIDFNIPRGFIVKIHFVDIRVEQITEDFAGISVDKIARTSIGLVKDPDDTTSTSMPNNNTAHDVLMGLVSEVLIVAGTAGDTVASFLNLSKQKNFSSEGLDVFTARNMRLNGDAFGTDAADITGAIAEVTIDYTLEKITDDLIISLLDIL